jgi:hypothetical protein
MQDNTWSVNGGCDKMNQDGIIMKHYEEIMMKAL